MLTDQETSLSDTQLTLHERSSMDRLPRCHLLNAPSAHLTHAAPPAGLRDVGASWLTR
jgi:hypothetical protein